MTLCSVGTTYLGLGDNVFMMTLLLLLIFSRGYGFWVGVDFPRRYLELTLILQTHIHSP